jgi:hypothetical protein
MLSHHTWARSMQRLDGIIERCIAEFGERVGALARSSPKAVVSVAVDGRR